MLIYLRITVFWICCASEMFQMVLEIFAIFPVTVSMSGFKY